MRPQWSSFRSVLRKAVWTVTFFLAWIADIGTSTCAVFWQSIRRLTHRVHILMTTGQRRMGELFSGPIREFVLGPLRVSLLGRRTDVSVLTVLLSPVLALAPAWWIAVSPSIGYRRIAALVQGTWVGTNPSLAVFVTVGVLITLGAISAAANSGIIPTTLLVSAPIFGVGATRYGTTLSYSGGAEVGVVSLPSAIGTAIFFAVSIGIPLSAVGFLLGSLSSRIIRVFQSHSAPTSSAEST